MGCRTTNVLNGKLAVPRKCNTVEVTFLRRSLGHGFKGLELGPWSSCIPYFLPNVSGGCRELLWQP